MATVLKSLYEYGRTNDWKYNPRDPFPLNAILSKHAAEVAMDAVGAQVATGDRSGDLPQHAK